MRRVFVVLLIVVAIWTGVEVYNEGVDGAFGGLLSGLSSASSAEVRATRSTADRAAGAFQRAYDKSEQRVDRLLHEDEQAK